MTVLYKTYIEFIKVLSILFYCLLVSTCDTKDSGNIAVFAWQTNEPLSIPLAERQRFYKAGNLLKNTSFEHGKIYAIDSSNIGYNVDGWKLVGKNVTRIDSTENVYTGGYAIKIHRQTANETDEKGEGVISDFIRIIPGNYTFSYCIKLKDVHSKNERFGTKLFDAIDIRIEFYDKNKIILPGDMYCPHLDKLINNSFRGYSFSGFYSMPELDWTRVYARSYNHPFSEGDVPDEAKYARVFLGLKGTGTMWVDDVDFRYSKWNFSAKERIMPFYDSVYAVADMIIPTPQKIDSISQIEYFNFKKQKHPIIISNQTESEAVKLVKLSLERKIKELSGKDYSVPVYSQLYNNQLNNASVIFSIGKSALAKQYENDLPWSAIQNIAQGHFLYSIDFEGVPLIFISGNNNVGDFYAATTLNQLINDSVLIYHNHHVIDFPTINERSFQIDCNLPFNEDKIKELAEYKVNGIFFKLTKKDISKCLQNQYELYTKVKNVYSDFGISITASEFYGDKNRLLDDTKLHELSYSPLFFQCNKVRLIGNDSFDLEEKFRYVPDSKNDSSVFSLKEITRSQEQLIKYFLSVSETKNKKIEIQFLPKWYNNEMIDRDVFNATNYYYWLDQFTSDDLKILWTGHTNRSLSVDNIDILRFNSVVSSEFLYFDNSVRSREGYGRTGGYAAYYPGKVRMCNLFEPIDIEIMEQTINNFQANIFSNSEIERLKLLSYAEFEWNSEAYNADYAIWKILNAGFGKELSINLFEYNDAYFGLWDMCMKLERNIGVTKNTKVAGEFLDQLELVIIELKDNDLDESLLKELTDKKEELKMNYYTIIRDLKNGNK